MKIIPTLVSCSVLLLPAAAIAADSTASATMHVSLEVVKSCTLKANDLNFSRHGSDESSEIQAKTQVDIVCTNGTPFTLTATSNDGENGTFWLKPETAKRARRRLRGNSLPTKANRRKSPTRMAWTIPATVRNRRKRCMASLTPGR